jgi:hypothetical protein
LADTKVNEFWQEPREARFTEQSFRQETHIVPRNNLAIEQPVRFQTNIIEEQPILVNRPTVVEQPVIVDRPTVVVEEPRDVIFEPQRVVETAPIIEIEPPIVEHPLITELEFKDVYVYESRYKSGPHEPYLPQQRSYVAGRLRRNN